MVRVAFKLQCISQLSPFLVVSVPVKCGETYEVDFVANFMENTTVKNCDNRSTFVRLMNECLVAVAQFLLRHNVQYISFGQLC